MVTFGLFISPGLKKGDDAEALARFEGETEESEHVSPARVKEVAAELAREHRLEVVPSDEPDDHLAVELSRMEGDTTAPEVRVDNWGVTIWCIGGGSAEAIAEHLKRSLAIARSASHLLGGAVFDSQRGVVADVDDPELLRSGTESLARAGEQVRAITKQGVMAKRILLITPILALVLFYPFLRGPLLFLAVFGTTAVTAALVGAWARRSMQPKPPEAQGQSFDHKPIQPG